MIAYLDLLAGLALATGMIVVMMNSQRVGLIPRWLGMLGIVTGLLLFFPFGGAQLQVIPALWMVMIGILFIGKWPNEPAAWVTGESRPWPTAAQKRAEADGGTIDAAPAPAPAGPPPSSRKRRRKPSAGDSAPAAD
jgi:hypothetical protein